MLRPDLLLHDAAGQAVWDWLAPLAEPMRFDGLPGLSPGQCDRYLALFGIDQALVDGLGTLPGAPDGLLYTGTGCWDPVEHDRMLGHQLDAIARLQDQGLLAPGLRLGYKGHPASRRGDERLLERLGPDTVVARVPGRDPRLRGEHVLFSGFKTDALRQYTGKRLSEVMRMRRQTDWRDTVIDLIVADGSRVGTVFFIMSEDNVRRQTALPWMTFGSDSSAIAAEDGLKILIALELETLLREEGHDPIGIAATAAELAADDVLIYNPGPGVVHVRAGGAARGDVGVGAGLRIGGRIGGRRGR